MSQKYRDTSQITLHESEKCIMIVRPSAGLERTFTILSDPRRFADESCRSQSNERQADETWVPSYSSPREPHRAMAPFNRSCLFTQPCCCTLPELLPLRTHEEMWSPRFWTHLCLRVSQVLNPSSAEDPKPKPSETRKL